MLSRVQGPHKVPRFSLLIATILIVPALIAACTQRSLRERGIGGDFITFYCAATALNEGADPYRAEPLGSCERSQRRPAIIVPVGVAMPAPLPPYALAVFCPLARLPYLQALALWDCIIVACTSLGLLAMQRLTRISLIALVCTFSIGTLVALDVGQVAPVSTAAIALCAYFVHARKVQLAAFTACVAMIEPHVALPACFALFIWMPRTRFILGFAAFAFAAFSVSLTGRSVAFEYLHDVLPAHALSEVSNQQQISLTYVAHRFGMPAVSAMRLGELGYCTMLVLGIWTTRKYAKRVPELVPALPVAFTLFGGAFIHVIQIPAALPAALILMRNAPSATVLRTIAIAIIVLALPIIHYPILYPLSITLYPAIAVILVSTLTGTTLVRVLACAVVAESAPLVLWALVHFPDLRSSLTPLVRAYDPRALADVSWAAYMDVIATTNPPQLDVFKLQIWFGLGTLVSAALIHWVAIPAYCAQRSSAVDKLSDEAPSGSP